MPARVALDASLVSIMLIVLISSGLIVLSLAGETVRRPLELLKNVHPERLYAFGSVTTKEKMDFSLGLLARGEFKTLEIQYATLVQATPSFIEENLTLSGLTALEIARMIRPLAILMAETDNELVPYEEIEVQAAKANRTYEGVFYDFPLVRMYSKRSLSDKVYTSFLILKNGTGALYFGGYSDFFLKRFGGFLDIQRPMDAPEVSSSIQKLRISRNDNATSYSSSVEVEEGWRSMDQLPGFGRVVFQDVRKNERFSVEFTIEIPERPAGMIAQVIRIYADGEMVENVVNLVE